MIAASKTKGGKGESKPSSAATAGRAYATPNAELTRPYIAGESPAEQKEAAQSWQWVILSALGVAVLIGYTRVWPLVGQLLYQPSPLRDYLLPPSADPVYVIAGVGVGWVWILFVAAPLAIAAAAGLWWGAAAWGNHRARAGHLGHVKPGQEWVGQTYPVGPVILAGAAVVLAAGGGLLRWVGPAASTAAGGAVLLAVFAVLGWGWGQLVSWARARGQINRQINRVTFLASPALGWTDVRAGRVQAVRCSYPPKAVPFPKVVKLLYGQHPRHMGDDVLREIAEVLEQVTGRNYVVDHQPLTRMLLATQVEVCDQDPELTAHAVLEPLVANWFDATASIVSVTVDEPTVIIDGDGNIVDRDGTIIDDGSRDAEEQDKAAYTDNDKLAARIREFTVAFAYSQKVGTKYRQGMIEAAVTQALKGSWDVQWSIPSRRAQFKRCPGLPTLVDPPLDFPVVTKATLRAIYKTARIPFAIDAYENYIEWDFRQSPHLLVAGPTSVGKTSLLMTVATQCAARGINVVWIDPKGFDSPGMRNWPNTSLVTAGTDEDGMVGHAAALRFIADTMLERLSQVKINPNKADDFDPIVVITDEFSNLVVALADFFKEFGGKGVPPTTRDVGIILRTARAVGIHMAIGIQRPDTMFIAGEARDNTALRVALGRLRSKDAAIMMFNDPVAGTRVQPGIKGRGTVQLPDGTFREIQAFYTPKVPATPEQRAELSDHERAVLDRLGRVDSFWPRRVVDSALRNYDPEDPDQKAEMSFAVIRNSPIVLASKHPELDSLSDDYVPPSSGVRRPTMDDDHDETDPGEVAAAWAPLGLSGGPRTSDGQAVPPTFAGPVDGFDDDYMPDPEEEYGPAVPVAAHDVEFGDLVDVSVDGAGEWRYVHAEPYRSDDEDGEDRLIIPYRDLEDTQAASDIEVDPYEQMQVRKLHMN